MWDYPWVQPDNTTTGTQAETLFWQWVSLRGFSTKEVKERQEVRSLSFILDQRDLHITFAHLVSKRQLYSEIDGLKRHVQSCSRTERGYCAFCFSTRTPDYLRSCCRLCSQMAIAFGQPTWSLSIGTHELWDVGYPRHFTKRSRFPQTRRSRRIRSTWYRSSPFRSRRAGGTLSRLFVRASFETLGWASGPGCGSAAGEMFLRLLRERVLVLKIALGLGPRGHAAAQSGKPGALRHDVGALGWETHELHDRVGRGPPTWKTFVVGSAPM